MADDHVVKKQILLVDDSSEVTQILKRLLSPEGEIEVTDNGEDALDKVRSKHFDLIISDVEMRKMSGFNFFLKAVEAEKSIRERFLFFSSSVPVEQSNFFTQNRVRFIMKPGSMETILNTAREIMNTES